MDDRGPSPVTDKQNSLETQVIDGQQLTSNSSPIPSSSDLQRPATGDGELEKHGWVTPIQGGIKARCGGPGICPGCQAELRALGAGKPLDLKLKELIFQFSRKATHSHAVQNDLDAWHASCDEKYAAEQAIQDYVSAAVQEAVERCAKIAEGYEPHERAHILDEGSRIAYNDDMYSWKIARDIRSLPHGQETE